METIARRSIAALVGCLLAMLVPRVSARPGTRAARAVVLVFDRSTSMRGERLEAVKQAVAVCLDALDPDDQIAVVAVDDRAHAVVPLQRVANREEILKSISRFTPAGGTNVGLGLETAFDILRKSKMKPGHVILVSDGETRTDGLAEVVHHMRDVYITVSAIGTSGADRNLLQMVAEAGEGYLYLVDDPKHLPKVIAEDAKTHSALN